MKRPTRAEAIDLLKKAQGNMFTLAGNLSSATPREVIEQHNEITKEVGLYLDEASR